MHIRDVTLALFIYYLKNLNGHILKWWNIIPKYSKTTCEPKTCRRREVDEPLAYKGRLTIYCAYCEGIGHNINDCLIDPTNMHKKTKMIGQFQDSWIVVIVKYVWW